MGFKDFIAQAAQEAQTAKAEGRAPVPPPSPFGPRTGPHLKFEGVSLSNGRVSYKGQGGPLDDRVVARVESGADVERRVTATRLATLSVFAFAAKKQRGTVFLTVEHPDWEFLVEVPVKKEGDARKFASQLNNAAKQKTAEG